MVVNISRRTNKQDWTKTLNPNPKFLGGLGPWHEAPQQCPKQSAAPLPSNISSSSCCALHPQQTPRSTLRHEAYHGVALPRTCAAPHCVNVPADSSNPLFFVTLFYVPHETWMVLRQLDRIAKHDSASSKKGPRSRIWSFARQPEARGIQTLPRLRPR